MTLRRHATNSNFPFKDASETRDTEPRLTEIMAHGLMAATSFIYALYVSLRDAVTAGFMGRTRIGYEDSWILSIECYIHTVLQQEQVPAAQTKLIKITSTGITKLLDLALIINLV